MIWTHVSELAIDRMLADEVAPVEAVALRDHAAGCARCAARLADALAVQRQFARTRPALPVPRTRRAPVYAAVTALAAGLAIVLAWPRHQAPEVRTKGTAIVGFFVAHGGEVRHGSPREVVSPGDRIELYTTTTEPAWLAVIGTDVNGRSVYVEPQRIEPGRERVLPLSIELDATLGDETVAGVFCSAAFDARTIDMAVLPAGCTVDRFTLHKAAP